MRKYRTNTAQQITKLTALRPFPDHAIIDSHRPSWQVITSISTVSIHRIIGYRINTFGTKELMLEWSALWYQCCVLIVSKQSSTMSEELCTYQQP